MCGTDSISMDILLFSGQIPQLFGWAGCRGWKKTMTSTTHRRICSLPRIAPGSPKVPNSTGFTRVPENPQFPSDWRIPQSLYTYGFFGVFEHFRDAPSAEKSKFDRFYRGFCDFPRRPRKSHEVYIRMAFFWCFRAIRVPRVPRIAPGSPKGPNSTGFTRVPENP